MHGRNTASKGTLWRLAILALLLTAAPAAALKVAGVDVPPQVVVQGEPLRLNGAGLARRFVFDVHVTGLYLQQPSRSATEVLGSEQTKHLRFWFKLNLSQAQLSQAVREGIVRNAGTRGATLQERTNRLVAALPAVKRGDVLTMTYTPGKGTRVQHNGRDVIHLPGKDFADALLSAWLGPRPITGNLKQELLQGGR